MDIEKALISKIIITGDFLTVTEEQIDGRYFSGGNRKVFKFVETYTEKYGKVPSPKTLKRHCPEFIMYSPKRLEEPLPYYLDEVREKTRHNKIVMGIREAVRELESGEEGAVALVTDLMSEIIYDVEGELKKTDRVRTNDSAKRRLERYLEISKSGGITGIPTGFDRFDRMTGGLKDEELIILIAFTNVGKTWLEIIFATFMKRLGYKVLFFTTEMGSEEILTRIEAVETRLNATRLSRGLLTPSEFAKYEKYLLKEEKKTEDDGIIIIEQVLGGVPEISAKTNQHDPDIVFVDGAYLLEDSSGDDDWMALVRVVRGLKKLARVNKIPVFMSTQSKTPEVSLQSIAFAQHIRADADVMFGIEQDTDMKEDKEMALVMLKQRNGENTGKIYHNWDFDKMDWSSIYHENPDGTREESDVSKGEVQNRDVAQGVMMID